MIHVQRLDPEAVADEGQLVVSGVPHPDREHSNEASDGSFDSPRLEGRENDFAIRVPAKPVAARLEFSTESLMVVDLTVKNHDETPAGGPHRLMPVLGQIDDRQPPESERDNAG